MKQCSTSIPSADITACRHRIRDRVTALCGVDGFIEGEDFTAFAGSKDDPRLVLTLSGARSGGRWYLYADLDDETGWQESDFGSRRDFEEDIAADIAGKVNQTVKWVTDIKKFTHLRFASYRLTPNGEWELVSDDTIAHPLVRLFLWKDKHTEEIKAYLLEN